MFKWIREWWNRPAAKRRILEVITIDNWIAGLDITRQAKVNIAQTYIITDQLIDEGLIEFKWDRSGLRTRGGRKRKMFRKINHGS
jgi:hypothetical protein